MYIIIVYPWDWHIDLHWVGFGVFILANKTHGVLGNGLTVLDYGLSKCVLRGLAGPRGWSIRFDHVVGGLLEGVPSPTDPAWLALRLGTVRRFFLHCETDHLERLAQQAGVPEKN